MVRQGYSALATVKDEPLKEEVVLRRSSRRVASSCTPSSATRAPAHKATASTKITKSTAGERRKLTARERKSTLGKGADNGEEDGGGRGALKRKRESKSDRVSSSGLLSTISTAKNIKSEIPESVADKKISGRASKATKEQRAPTQTDVNDNYPSDQDQASSPPPAPKITKLIQKGRTTVDPYCPGSIYYVVVQTPDCTYDIMLNQTNIASNNNKFYLIQILQHEITGNYVVWMRWGRVGNQGQWKLTPCDSLVQAIHVFETKYHDKTKNEWSAGFARFVKVAGKYDRVEIAFADVAEVDDQEVQTDAVASNSSSKTVVESTLQEQVQILIKTIFNLDMIKRQLMEIGYNSEQLPLGKLSKSQIKRGYEVLDRISSLLLAKKPATHRAAVIEACSQFYTIIPHVFGMKRPPVIDTLPAVKKKLEMLESLEDMEIATRLLKKEGSASSAGENILDRHYLSLGAAIRPMDTRDAALPLILQSVNRTHGDTHSEYKIHVQHVFDVARSSESVDMLAKYGNRRLLWHGSRLSNFVGILSAGLKIAPPEAPSTGYMFGKGVYFADMVSKSANYSRTHSERTGILLLCEVVLGRCKELTEADYNADKHIDYHTYFSTKGVGRTQPDPAFDMTVENGKDPLVLHAGPGIPSGVDSELQYDEYIVYDVAQVRIRYLVMFEFIQPS